MAVIADGHLGLSTTLEGERSRPHRFAVPAVAIPLRKATPGGRAQDLYAHSCSLQFSAGVGVDFAVQTNLFKLRASPFHGSLLRVRY